MNIGDVLEWLAAALITTSAYLWSGTVLALAVAGLFAGYFAQCYSDLRLHRAPRPRRAASQRGVQPINLFHCGKCGGSSPHGEPHTCLKAS